MSVFPISSLTGEYNPTLLLGKDETPTNSAVIVNAFGFREDDEKVRTPGPMNIALARYADRNFSDHAILVSPDVAPALETDPDLIFDLESTTESLGTLKNRKTTGTAGELLQARAFMLEHDYSSAIIVAHAFHVARVARMAKKLDIVTEIPDGLPTIFDAKSAQKWTQSRDEWIKREPLTIAYLTLHRMM